MQAQNFCIVAGKYSAWVNLFDIQPERGRVTVDIITQVMDPEALRTVARLFEQTADRLEYRFRVVSAS